MTYADITRSRESFWTSTPTGATGALTWGVFEASCRTAEKWEHQPEVFLFSPSTHRACGAWGRSEWEARLDALARGACRMFGDITSKRLSDEQAVKWLMAGVHPWGVTGLSLGECGA